VARKIKPQDGCLARQRESMCGMGDMTRVSTRLGSIAAEVASGTEGLPLVLLHGVYLDRHLWDYQVNALRGRTIVTVDMPHHGDSTGANLGWSMDDCAQMLLDVLDSLAIEKAVVVGHSWGSMTTMRAAVRSPERFAAIGLCNMPLEPGTASKIAKYRLQATLLPLRRFYARQAAKALFAPESLRGHPEFVDSLVATMGRLSNAEVRHVDMAVVINPDDGFRLLCQLSVPALTLKGEKDYVPEPPGLDVTIVPGGHISPMEAPDEVLAFIRRVLLLDKTKAD
jgi:3-oxoadipate enol-lactonase